MNLDVLFVLEWRKYPHWLIYGDTGLKSGEDHPIAVCDQHLWLHMFLPKLLNWFFQEVSLYFKCDSSSSTPPKNKK